MLTSPPSPPQQEKTSLFCGARFFGPSGSTMIRAIRIAGGHIQYYEDTLSVSIHHSKWRTYMEKRLYPMGSKLTSRLPPILRSYYIVSFQGGWYLIIPRFFCWKNAYPFLPYDDHKTTHLGPPGTSSSSSSRRGEVAVLLEMTDIGDIKDVKRLFTNIFSDSLKGLGVHNLGNDCG